MIRKKLKNNIITSAILENAGTVQEIEKIKLQLMQNTQDIATNKGDIATNTLGVTSNRQDITTLQQDMSDIKQDIAVNEQGIADIKKDLPNYVKLNQVNIFTQNQFVKGATLSKLALKNDRDLDPLSLEVTTSGIQGVIKNNAGGTIRYENAATPRNPSDVATKQYVDDKAGNKLVNGDNIILTPQGDNTFIDTVDDLKLSSLTARTGVIDINSETHFKDVLHAEQGIVVNSSQIEMLDNDLKLINNSGEILLVDKTGALSPRETKTLLDDVVAKLKTYKPFSYKGNWQQGTAYNQNDIVTDKKKEYLSLKDNNTDDLTVETSWVIFGIDAVDLSDYYNKQEIDGKFNTTNANVTANTGNISNNTQAINALQTQKADASEIARIDKELAAEKAKIQQNQNDIATINTNKANQTEITRIDGEISTINQSVQQNTTDVGTLKTDIAAIETDIQNVAKLPDNNTFTGNNTFNNPVAINNAVGIKTNNANISLVEMNNQNGKNINFDYIQPSGAYKNWCYFNLRYKLQNNAFVDLLKYEIRVANNDGVYITTAMNKYVFDKKIVSGSATSNRVEFENFDYQNVNWNTIRMVKGASDVLLSIQTDNTNGQASINGKNGNLTIAELANPVRDRDAATKQYVDTSIYSIETLLTVGTQSTQNVGAATIYVSAIPQSAVAGADFTKLINCYVYQPNGATTIGRMMTFGYQVQYKPDEPTKNYVVISGISLGAYDETYYKTLKARFIFRR